MLSNNLIKGIAAQILIFFTNILISFVYTPYLLSKIGAEAYAFYPLSFNIITYASVLTVIFTSMLSKYITVDYRSGNYARMNEFFNSSLRGNFIIGTVVGIPMLVGSLFADKIFNIPSSLTLEVKILFMLITIAFFIIQLRNTFIVANITTDKRYLTGFQKFYEKIVIVLVPVVVFIFVKPSVVWLGVAVVSGVVVRLFITIRTQKKIMPELKVEKKYVDNDVTKTLVSGGLWHSFNQLIILLHTNVEILLANLMFGAFVQSEYALAVVIPNLIRSMTIYLNNRILPYLALLFKCESYDELRRNIPRFTKCMSVIMGAISGVLIGFGDVFLSLWISDFYSVNIYMLMVLSVLSVFVTGSFSILYIILVVHDKLKMPAFVMLALGVINIPLSFILSRFFDIYGILISSLIINISGYMIFIPTYLSKIVKFDKEKIYPGFLKGVYVLLIAIALSLICKSIFLLNSFAKLILAVIVIAVILILIIFIRFFSVKDMSLIIDSFTTNVDDNGDYNDFI